MLKSIIILGKKTDKEGKCMIIRDVKREDSRQICEIYNYYIENTAISFEETAVTQANMEKRIDSIISSFPWLVADLDGEILGYAYASKWKERIAYRYSVELSIYIKSNILGQGIGTRLYGELIDRLRKKNIHSMVGGIAIPNIGSQKIHEKFGFEKVAHFKEVGFKVDTWIDVEYWQLILE